MTTGYGRGSGFLPRSPVPKDRHWHKRENRVAEAFYAQLYPGGYPGWSVGPEYAEPDKPKARR